MNSLHKSDNGISDSIRICLENIENEAYRKMLTYNQTSTKFDLIKKKRVRNNSSSSKKKFRSKNTAYFFQK
ncbi:hypothetical protein BpHYR1_023657 [Brachionus plicatilis]|uniref:Uncharacterized protein n=1 Tax=Brachionus plicatilis TaxID=10195 RepID=A0A3M7STT5_BRAPC|nr:hypothetical protein BpHYR1_023657 [Brachionus plicatilis]